MRNYYALLFSVIGPAVLVACGASTTSTGDGTSGGGGAAGAAGAAGDGGGGAGGDAGGAGAAGAAGSGVDPLNDPSTACAFGQGTTSHNQNMRPGEACNGGCHTHFSHDIMGTVYSTGHQADDCKGDGTVGAVVVITDCNGNQVQTLTVNTAGNFIGSLQTGALWCVEVQANGVTRQMVSPPDNVAGVTDPGNCNSCHTQDGANGAPGRITIPAP